MIRVVPLKLYHCGRMARNLRTEHRQAVANVGADIHLELRHRFYESTFAKALFIDDELVAIGGVTGSTMAAYGYAWFAVTNKASKHPKAVIQVVRDQIDEIMTVYRELATTIISGDEAGRRMAVFLGFHTEDDGPGAPAFSKQGRRMLHKHLRENPDIRIPVGNGYCIAMGYHRDEGA